MASLHAARLDRNTSFKHGLEPHVLSVKLYRQQPPEPLVFRIEDSKLVRQRILDSVGLRVLIFARALRNI